MIGLDVSKIRVERAQRRAQDFGVADRARFEVTDFVATGLPASSVDGAISVDVILFIPDKAGAMHEVARILKSGARFVFTNWDRDLSPPGYLPPLNDHRPLLQDAGFAIEAYDIQPNAGARACGSLASTVELFLTSSGKSNFFTAQLVEIDT